MQCTYSFNANTFFEKGQKNYISFLKLPTEMKGYYDFFMEKHSLIMFLTKKGTSLLIIIQENYFIVTLLHLHTVYILSSSESKSEPIP